MSIVFPSRLRNSELVLMGLVDDEGPSVDHHPVGYDEVSSTTKESLAIPLTIRSCEYIS